MNNIVYLKIFDNGKFYIGISKNFKNRMYQHHYDAFVRNSQLPVHCAMRKHKHETEILFQSESYDDVLVMEKIVIQNFKDLGYELYNVTDGGEGTLGVHLKFSEEHKAKISSALKGRVFSKEHLKHMSISRKGKPLSKEHKEKLKGKISPMKGKQHSKISKSKMSQCKKGKYNGENNPNYHKPVPEERRKKISEQVKDYYHKYKYTYNYYANTYVKRSIFKRTCSRRGWNFDDFLEVDYNVIKQYNSGRKEKHYLYIHKSLLLPVVMNR